MTGGIRGELMGLARALETLDEAERDAVILCHSSRLDDDEIAMRLSVTPDEAERLREAGEARLAGYMGCPHDGYRPLSYYGVPGVRETCHALKEGSPIEKAVAADTAAAYLAGFAGEGDVLIPAPSHEGRAAYTLLVARMISMRTGATVADILSCEPHEPLYDMKLRGEAPRVRMRLIGDVPESGRLLFVDNVIDTGATFMAAKDVIGDRLRPLAYASSGEGRDADGVPYISGP